MLFAYQGKSCTIAVRMDGCWNWEARFSSAPSTVWLVLVAGWIAWVAGVFFFCSNSSYYPCVILVQYFNSGLTTGSGTFGARAENWTSNLRQVHVGFSYMFAPSGGSSVVSSVWVSSVLHNLIVQCIEVIISEFSVQFRHMPTFPVTTVVNCPLCLFQSPKLSDTGCVHSGESHL
jgi:hypothetical protein